MGTSRVDSCLSLNGRPKRATSSVDRAGGRSLRAAQKERSSVNFPHYYFYISHVIKIQISSIRDKKNIMNINYYLFLKHQHHLLHRLLHHCHPFALHSYVNYRLRCAFDIEIQFITVRGNTAEACLPAYLATIIFFAFPWGGGVRN